MKPKIKSMDLEKLLGKRFVSEKHQVDFIELLSQQRQELIHCRILERSVIQFTFVFYY